jgi:ribose 5-phosphate isomerase RpiB
VQLKAARRGDVNCCTDVGAALTAHKVSGICAAVRHREQAGHQAAELDRVNMVYSGNRIVGR